MVAVWTGSPEPLCDLVAAAAGVREPDRTAADVALACWAVLVMIPRGLLHLASWVLAHPVRAAAAAVLLVVLLATV